MRNQSLNSEKLYFEGKKACKRYGEDRVYGNENIKDEEYSFYLIVFDKVYRSIRRQFYYNFEKEYIIESLKNRKGNCDWQKCKGCCGDLLIKCKEFDEKTGLCKVWENEKKMLCGGGIIKEYPFDERDKSLRTRKKCTYYWEKEARK